MGGRGASAGVRGSYGRTTAQDKTIKKFAKRTANLKNEQYRIIDADGNVVFEKKGNRDSVASTVGEKREYLNGNISLHNHPDGGTFSADDLRDFGYGAKEIVISTPEGTYRLINRKYGTKNESSGWYNMHEKLTNSVSNQLSLYQLRKQARKNTENSETAKSIREITNKANQIRATKGVTAANQYWDSVKSKYDSLNKKLNTEINKEKRRIEVQPYHDFYKQNANKYGFTYRFEKN